MEPSSVIGTIFRDPWGFLGVMYHMDEYVFIWVSFGGIIPEAL